MPATADSILAQLDIVDAERSRRNASPELAGRVDAIKRYQQRRFSQTYSDLLAAPRYAGAARFFLDELYGPSDFSHRDAQFARMVPALVKLFPEQIVGTVATLAELHALSETLDTRMGSHWASARGAAPDYVRAWRATGDPEARQRQIELTLAVGASLDRLTRKPLVYNSLRLMRRPAQAAGLGELQRFLEAGFDTFRAMRGATEFLALVDTRERDLAAALFGNDLAESGVAPADDPSLLQRLPG